MTATMTSSGETSAYTPEDLTRLLDPKNTKEFSELYDKGNFPVFLQNYLNNFAEESQAHIDAQIDAQMGAVLTELLKKFPENTGNRPPTQASVVVEEEGIRRIYSRRKTHLPNKKAPGAPLDSLRRPLHDYFMAVTERARDVVDPHNLKELHAQSEAARQKYNNDYGTVIPAEGGILIPETLRSEIMSLALEASIVRGRATPIAMQGGNVIIPAVESSSHAESVFGGVVATWQDEATAPATTSATFRGIELNPKKLMLNSSVANELMADSPAFESWFMVAMPEAQAYFEDLAFIDGNGTSRPQGFKNASAAVTVAAEVGQPATTIVWENLVKMFSRMLPQSLNNAVWIANLDTFPELATMAQSVGTGGSAVWLENGEESRPMSILGRPLVFSEKMETLGTAGDIMFVDLKYYLVGDRQSIQFTSSMHSSFTSDKTDFKVISRVDGRPWLSTALTPRKSASTLSPFVKLATRS